MDKVFYILLGGVIVLLNCWYFSSLYSAFFSRRVVLAPFRVIGSSDEGAEYGKTLASLLDARLVQILRDLEYSQRTLRHKPAPTESNGESVGGPANDPRTSYVSPLPLPLIHMNTNLFQPADIDISVSGVEIGGIFAWMQRRMASPRTIRFSVYIDQGKATISGDLAALSSSPRDSVWLEAKPDPLDITDKIAYAVIQRKLVEAQTESIAALEVDEVQTLLTTLFRVAELNRRADAGRPIGGEIKELFPAIERIAEKVPDWPSLVVFAASMAESSGQVDSALGYYQKLKALEVKADGQSIPISVAMIEQKIADLTPLAEIVAQRQEQSFIHAVEDYATRMALPGLNPEMVFKKLEHAGQQTFWDSESSKYEISIDHIDSPELPAYIALMGRFMRKNYDKCFKGGASPPTAEDWNEFRYSLTQYLIETDSKIQCSREPVTPHWRLQRVLNRLGADSSTESVRRLVRELLDRYECGWKLTNLASHAVKVNQELQLVPENAIKNAFASEGLE